MCGSVCVCVSVCLCCSHFAKLLKAMAIQFRAGEGRQRAFSARSHQGSSLSLLNEAKHQVSPASGVGISSVDHGHRLYARGQDGVGKRGSCLCK